MLYNYDDKGRTTPVEDEAYGELTENTYDDDGFSAYYLQSRYYEDKFNRFLNADIPDIAYQSKDETNGLNLFAYCNNNPVNGVDPTGFWTCSFNKKGQLMNTYGKIILPTYEPKAWKSVKNSTNCYAYALNIKDKFPNGYSLQPGAISGKHFSKYTTLKKRGVDLVIYQLLTAFKADLAFLKMRFVYQVQPYVGGYCVALVIAYTKKSGLIDYHWYREDSPNSWSHKRGHSSVTNVDARGNKITNPKYANRNYGGINYSVFVGIYRVGVPL